MNHSTDWPHGELVLSIGLVISMWDLLPQDLPWLEEMSPKQRLGTVGPTEKWPSLRSLKSARGRSKLNQEGSRVGIAQGCSQDQVQATSYGKAPDRQGIQ